MWELLHQPADVERILAVIVGVERLRVVPSDVPALRALRAAITRTARGAAGGVVPGADDIAVINAAAARSPLVPRLTHDGAAVVQPGSARQALSTLARDAIDLFSSPLLVARIRVCAADDCELLLLDTSRPGTRRWCSMERCGDRAKKRSARGG